MRKFFLLIGILATGLFSCAQKGGPAVKKAYAFYTSHMPGMQMVDEKGNRVNPVPTIERVIYLECSGSKEPVLNGILYAGKSMKATLSRISGNMVAVGKLSEKSHEYTLLAQKGNTLWKVEMETPDVTEGVAADCKSIIIRTKYAGKIYKTFLYQETELYTPPSY